MATHLSHSRAFPVAFDEAYQRLLTAPLESILGRRFAAIPGMKRVEQDGEWGSGGVGQQRILHFTDGGSVRETLTLLDAPHAFGYQLDAMTGAMKLLIGGVSGRWAFAPAGTGTQVTWSWDVTPASPAAGLALPVFGRMWKGFARQGFDDIETYLLT